MITDNDDCGADVIVDASGLNCPLPILKARKAMMTMAPGQTLKVIATDPASAEDFPVFATATGHALIKQMPTDGRWIFVLRVGG